MTRGTSTPATADASVPDDHGDRAYPDDRRLLHDARAGDADAVASLYDRHASALYAFARTVLGEGSPAEETVVDVIVDACGPAPVALSPHRSVRHGLAVATYHRCAAPGPLSGEARARAVLALCLHGEHTHREAAALTGVACAPLGRLLLAEMTGRGLPLSA